ncbi:MAG: hypothetical protein FWF73_02425 [Spirochaetes bacterium]|nr:hypothetical protein [Spirochaetota bacterium]
MKYTKNIVKILLLAQCFLLFCTCDKEVVTTEQHELNLIAFVTCPFNEKFDSNTNLEKYVLKKFGKPYSVSKWRDKLGLHREPPKAPIEVDQIVLRYEKKYEFEITRGINKKIEFFKMIFLLDFTDLKYGINKDTTIKDIEKLFGNLGGVTEIEDVYEINYYYTYSDDSPYGYTLKIVFRKGKLDYIDIRMKFDPYLL